MEEMFFGEFPSFEELMNSLFELEKEIHKIKRNEISNCEK